MSATNHHTDGPECLFCIDKMKKAHPVLQSFFTSLKKQEMTVHVCWSWRGKDDQNRAFDDGKSTVVFPNSKHNSVDLNGNPCSRAIDLFTIDEDGSARFEVKFYRDRAWRFIQENRLPLAWGGNFTKIKDYDHFELLPSIRQPG